MGSLSQTSQAQNQSGTTNSTTAQNPWAPQANYLNQGFQSASNALGQAQGANANAPSNFVAQFSPQALSTFQNMIGYGGNSSIPNSSAALGNSLTGSGGNAVNQGLSGLAGWTPGNTPDALLSAANAFSNNPATQGMIDAATRDARRAAYEDAIPQIERDANISGNINSNRTGISEGIVRRGLGDTVADTSANIRGNMFNTGLGAALSQLTSNDSNKLASLGMLSNYGNSAARTGLDANSGAVSQAGGLFNIANSGIGGQNAASQAALNNPLAQYQFNTQSPFAGLNNFWDIVGNRNWGGTGTTAGTTTGQGTTVNTPSTMAQIGQGLGLLSSILRPRS